MAARSLRMTSCSIGPPRSLALLHEAEQLGRRLAGKSEPLEREAVPRIVDPDGKTGKRDQRGDGRGGDAGQPTERRDRNKPMADVFVQVAVMKRRWRLDGLVRLAFPARPRNVATISRRFGRE